MNWLTLPGLTPYLSVENLMEKIVDQIIAKRSSETILLVEHEDVYTAGTNSKAYELLINHKANKDNLTRIPIIKIGRGGKYTYHGPGQRVIYPMLDLALPSRQKDIKLYIHNLELWLINVLKEIGIKAYSNNERVGIWVNYKGSEAKIGAIGVRVKKWVTYHGIAINISTDLDKFSGIIPCGLENFQVTSLFELGVRISIADFDNIVKKEFYKVFI